MKNKKILNLNSLIFLFLIYLFSHVFFIKLNIGFDPDYINYLKMYENVDLEFLKGQLAGEFVFYTIIMILKLIGLSADFTFWSIILFSLLLKTWCFLKLTRTNTQYFLLLYFPLFFLLHEMIQIRFAISSAFFLVGFYYLESKKQINKKSVVFFLLSIFCHFSSAILVVLSCAIIIISKEPKKIILSLLSVIFFSIIFVQNLAYDELVDILISNPRLSSYVYDFMNNKEEGSINFLNSLTLLSFITLLISVFNLSNPLSKYAILFELFGLLIFYLMSNLPVIAFRILELSNIFTPYVMAIHINSLRKNLVAKIYTVNLLFLYIITSLIFTLRNFSL